MHNQILRGFIFIILVFLVTSDLKEIISTIATSSSIGAFLQRPSSSSHGSRSSQNYHQRSKRQISSSGPSTSQSTKFRITINRPIEDHDDAENMINPPISSSWNQKFSSKGIKESDTDNSKDSASADNDYESLDPATRLKNHGQNQYMKKKIMKLNDEEKKELLAMKSQLTAVMQEWCLPKLVCELYASVSDRGESLTEAEKGLLSLIRETSLGTMGEVVSRYHFAAHMGQLLSGVEGNGCHNFYPNCPLSGNRVLQMMKKVRIR